MFFYYTDIIGYIDSVVIEIISSCRYICGCLVNPAPRARFIIHNRFPQKSQRDYYTGCQSRLEQDCSQVFCGLQPQELVHLPGHNDRIARIEPDTHKSAEIPLMRLGIPVNAVGIILCDADNRAVGLYYADMLCIRIAGWPADFLQRIGKWGAKVSVKYSHHTGSGAFR